MTELIPASSPSISVPHPLVVLSADELDATRGGLDPLMLAIGVFSFGAVAGILDRLIFGGCRCG